MRELLHRIGFSSKKPRPTHHKSASKEEQNRFKKNAKRTIKKYSNLGYTTLCLDESTNRIAPNMKRGWYLTGEHTTTQINYTREKFQSFGALGNKGVFFCKFYDKSNTDSFLDFIKSLQKQ